MLGNLKPQAPDKILALMGEFKADPRQGKIDLGVGVYKDADGHTPIMRAVKAAEQRMLETEITKTYSALAGEPDFQKAMAELICGERPAMAFNFTGYETSQRAIHPMPRTA